MKKTLILFVSVIWIATLTGCAQDVEVSEQKPKEKVEVKTEEAQEKKVPEVKEQVTFAEFDSKNKRDPEEKQYIDGLFILEDGTRVNADYINYVDGEYYDYASAIFYEGKMAKIQLETSASISEVEAGLGIKFNDVIIVEPIRIGYEIIFDKTFADENIHLNPFELD